MDPTQENKFSASAPLAGYIYQCRFALLEALRKLRLGEQFKISIETMDDVVFEDSENAIELLQLKHHLDRQADLSDSSTDIWKSLRNWSDSFKIANIQKDVYLFLITTAEAVQGSAAAYLRAGTERDTSSALKRLEATAGSSTNQTNKLAYNAFRNLADKQRKLLIDSLIVIDRSPIIDEINERLEQELYYAVEAKYLTSFIQRLEGWWLQRVILHLKKSNRKPILSEEIYAEITEIREQFKLDNLPIDDDIMNASIDATGYQDQKFVHQLRLIEIGNNRIFFAIQNYFRAFTHRSRWVREELVGVGELQRYEDRLVEEWNIYFERMREEIGDSATEEEKRKAAQALYKWFETSHLPIRERVHEPSITRGSYQILSDNLKVGWHIEFEERMKALLEKQGI